MARASRSRPRRRPGKHLLARTTGIRIINRAAFAVLLIVLCVAVGVLSVPQLRNLRALKEELRRAEAQEEHARSFNDQKARELKALREDPRYLELVARDRLDLQRPGEKIFRFNR